MQLADGKLIQLSGRLGRAELPALRRALLSPLFVGCRDVVIDAGEVIAVDDEAIAVIAAADEWATYAGARLLLSRATPVVEHALAELDFSTRIRRLSDLGAGEPKPVLVPVPSPSD
jgi:anti-anti-sigma regulatory factor